MMQVKYAYLVFDSPFPFPRDIDFQFSTNTRVRSGNFKSYVNQPGWEHWAKWLGSLTWEDLSGKNKIILSTWMQSATAEVIDGENQTLEGRLQTLFRMLPLVGPFSPPRSDAFLFSGLGTLAADGVHAIDQRTFSRIRPWTRPFFDENVWQPFHDWSFSFLTSTDRLNDWKDCSDEFDRHLFGAGTKRQLVEAFRSFEEAVRGSQLEFKIPNLVRAIECLVDCWGQKQFASKVLHLTGQLPADLPYSVSVNTTLLLENLYELRNDCSHGKPFAYSLEKKIGGNPSNDLVATYEFLVEWTARKLILGAFKSPSLLAACGSRDSLVEAWKQTPFPTL